MEPSKKELLDQIENFRKTLNPEQNQILESKYIQGSRSAQDWLQLLRGLAEYDRQIDEFIEKFKPKDVTSIGCLYYGILGGVFLFLAVNELFNPITGIVMGVLVLLPMIYYGIKYRNPLKKYDLPNYLRNFVLPLLYLLREESEPDQAIDLQVNLHSIKNIKERTDDPNLKAQEKTSWTASRKQVFFEGDLIEIVTQLADRTLLKIRISLIIRERQRYKSKGNKVKLKVVCLYQMQLLMPKKAYERQEESSSDPSIAMGYMDKGKRHLFKLKLKEEIFATKTTFKGNHGVEYNKLKKHIEKTPALDPKQITRMMAQVYRRVKPLSL